MRQGEKREHGIVLLSTGSQAVPMTEPSWDYNMAKRGWDQNHSVRGILEGLKRAHAKTLDYAKLADWWSKWQVTPVFLPGESQGRGSLGGLPSMGLHRVGHDWSDLAAASWLTLYRERRELLVNFWIDYGRLSTSLLMLILKVQGEAWS